LLLSQVLTVVLTSALAVLIARGLQPGDWGTFSAFLGLGLAVSIVVDFGLGTWLLRELSRLWADEDISATKARAHASWLSTHAAVVSSAIGLASVCFAVVFTLARGRFSLTPLAAGLLGYGALLGTANGLDAYLRSRRRIRLLVAFIVAEKGLLVTLVIVVELVGLGVSWIALAYVVAGTVRLALVGLAVFVGDHFGLAKEHLRLVRPRWRGVREVTAGSFPFALNTASLNVIPRLDTFALLAIAATSAGYFATGERVLGPALLVPVALSTTLYPFLSREVQGARSVRVMSALLAAAGLALAVAGSLSAPLLVPLVFGEHYQRSIPVVQIIVFALPFIYASNPLLTHLYVVGREKIVVRLTLAVSLLGTVGIIVGQLLAGPAGAATGFVFRQAVILGAVLVLEVTVAASSRRPPPAVIARKAAVPRGESP
jgi:O-antigen/teichoic acid export membrane protein